MLLSATEPLLWVIIRWKQWFFFFAFCVFIYSLTFCQSNELLGKMEVKSTFWLSCLNSTHIKYSHIPFNSGALSSLISTRDLMKAAIMQKYQPTFDIGNNTWSAFSTCGTKGTKSDHQGWLAYTGETNSHWTAGGAHISTNHKSLWRKTRLCLIFLIHFWSTYIFMTWVKIRKLSPDSTFFL